MMGMYHVPTQISSWTGDFKKYTLEQELQCPFSMWQDDEVLLTPFYDLAFG